MVYQDNPGCDTTFYKVCSEYWFNAMSLRIQKHPKSTEMAVNLSLICAGMILTVEVDFPKVSGEKKLICVRMQLCTIYICRIGK